ncbi:MAG TPA: diaminopimelate decarboxylase [Anaerohalosphaeraceae bacterium]|nr:diaminopimelate decarboxylase [Anaerohalosphaeraceae bacterium]HOL31854.1 diaminopimelate decarboxylase [Anaerohalosphaeraceae bacterium]HOM75076.1 diaminopimelate decarboxylase [Anaerohalosphaeraceae bacterium]HPC63169.1 diaminopimelate decarboxylase [Anaerohalosphaeraceae bacterium]HPO68958.1 diaminopimelate decarboxylase [Anaerohalosphaeraceae bacterium]
MDSFIYKKGKLFVEGVDVTKIAQQVGTPVYIYSKATILDHLRKIQTAYAGIDTTVCYSIKACGNINILRLMAQAGSGFDIVSGGELYRAVQAGADMKKVVFAGVGKTDKEILEALDAGIAYFNIESEAELENLIQLCRQCGKKTKAALRINPDIRYDSHRHITTGVKETKFGVDIERAQKVFDQYAGNGVVELSAVHVHLGSGGKTIDPYVSGVKKILPLIDILRAKGYKIDTLDLGGGYGADYETDTVPSAADYASGIVPLLKEKSLKLILEPGKSIIANAAILLTQTLYKKTGGQKTFVIVDAGMNDLIRPCLYEAFHFIWPVQVDDKFVPEKRSKDMEMPGTEIVDIVGPICESTDYFAKDRALPPVKRGDLIAIFTAGAYGFSMASNYNARLLPAEVLVDGDTFSVIRKRQTYDDLVALEK